MSTAEQKEAMRRQRHVHEVYGALAERLAAARTAQTVLNDLAASGRVHGTHTNECWVALEDEIQWLSSSHDAVAALAAADAYDMVAFWSPEAIRRGVEPTPAPRPTETEAMAVELNGMSSYVYTVVDTEDGGQMIVTGFPVVLGALYPYVEIEGTGSGWAVRGYVDEARERRPGVVFNTYPAAADVVDALVRLQRIR